MAYYFNKVSIIAIVSNLVILPVIGILLAAGFAMFFADMLGPVALLPVAKITGWLISLVAYFVNMFAAVPHATVRVPTPALYYIALFYVIIIGIPRFKNYIWKRVVIGALALTVGIFAFRTYVTYEKGLSITFIDVGLGDSIFCEFPDGTNMLVDGGGNWSGKYDIGESVLSPFLWNKGVLKIDRVVVTHPHYNHFQGLLAVCRNFKIGKFITTYETSEEAEYVELIRILKSNSVPIELVSAGASIKAGGAVAEVLWPEDKLRSDSDENSIVLRIAYGNFSALLCSDITRIIQNKLTEKDIASRVLLVPNHGKKLLLLDFLTKVSPELAVMSSNSPSRQVWEQFEGTRVLTTAASGTITVHTNGKSTKIKEMVPDAPIDMIIQDIN
jgi:competence protein ComEC